MTFQRADSCMPTPCNRPIQDGVEPDIGQRDSIGNRLSRHKLQLGLMLLLLLAIIAQLVGVFRRSFHWDEFLFLANVYRSISGESLRLLQTSYVYLFTWIPSIGGIETDQILVARGLYVIIWAASLGLLYRLGCRLLDDRLGALVGVVLFALFPFSLVHAASFRIDGLLLPCLIGLALLLLQPTTLRLLLAGLIGALALALSIKAVLWAPAFLAILVFSATDRRQITKLLTIGLAVAIAGLCGLFLVRAGITHAGIIGGPAAITFSELNSIAYRMFVEEGFFPNRQVFVESVRSGGPIWLMTAFGAFLAGRDLFSPEKRIAGARQLFAASPVVSVLFYANSWQYAYVILLPTSCLLAGRAVSFLIRSGLLVRRMIATACLLSALLPLFSIAWIYRHDGQLKQAQVLSIVHRVFPEPVAYIDKSGMVSSFAGLHFPLTGLRIKAYRATRKPALSRFIEEAQPPMMIVNTRVLDLWQGGAEAVPERFRLLLEDEAMVRRTYAPFWGPIYLAGREWRGLNAREQVQFDITIGGVYTLHSDSNIMIDGRLYLPGASVKLDAGSHHLETVEGAKSIRLLWGAGLKIPSEVATPEPVFFGYGPA